jgi:hypothetical protein
VVAPADIAWTLKNFNVHVALWAFTMSLHLPASRSMQGGFYGIIDKPVELTTPR